MLFHDFVIDLTNEANTIDVFTEGESAPDTNFTLAILPIACHIILLIVGQLNDGLILKLLFTFAIGEHLILLYNFVEFAFFLQFLCR